MKTKMNNLAIILPPSYRNHRISDNPLSSPITNLKTLSKKSSSKISRQIAQLFHLLPSSTEVTITFPSRMSSSENQLITISLNYPITNPVKVSTWRRKKTSYKSSQKIQLIKKYNKFNLKTRKNSLKVVMMRQKTSLRIISKQYLPTSCKTRNLLKRCLRR
jgi:hypothetical protein